MSEVVTTRVNELPQVPSGSLSNPSQVLLYVQDTNAGAINNGDNNLPLNLLQDPAPTVLSPSSPITLSGTEQTEVLVKSTNIANTVTVPNNQTVHITNISVTSAELEVITSGNPNTTLDPGESLWAVWNGTTHDVAVETGGSGGVIDNVMSDSSPNAVENQVIKAYVDSQVGITVDDTLTDAGTNPVEGGVIKAYVDAVEAAIPTTDTAMDDVSVNPIANSVVKAYVDAVAAGGSIDTVMDDISTAAVQNKVIKRYVDQRGLVRSWDKVIGPADSMATAVSALNTQGYGTLWIDGEVAMPVGNQTFTGCQRVRGLGENSAIFRDDGGGAFIWQNQSLPMRAGTQYGKHAAVAIWPDTAAFAFEFTAPMLTAVDGDWVYILSDTPVQDGPWHTTNDPYHPMELHQIKRAFNRTYTVSAVNTSTNFLSTSVIHRFVDGNRVIFSSTGTLPSPLAAATPYYVVQKVGGDFKVSSSYGGTEIDITTAGSGTITVDGFDTTYELSDMIRDPMTTRLGPVFTVAGATFTSSNHGLSTNQEVYITTTGSLSPIVPVTPYYVRDVTTNTFSLAATIGGGAITPSAPSGTHTIEFKPRVALANFPVAPGSNQSNVVVDNLRIHGGGDTSQLTTFWFENLDGVTLDAIQWEHKAGVLPPALVNIKGCTRLRIGNCNMDGHLGSSPQVQSAYWVLVTCVNELRIKDMLCKEAAHLFTTGGDSVTIAGVPCRFGTALNVVVEDSTILAGRTNAGGGQPALDTHAEGWGVTFQNNTIIAPGTGTSNVGISIRSRHTIVRNNTILGNKNTTAIRISAPDCQVYGNVEFNCLSSIIVQYHDGPGGSNQPWNNLIYFGNVSINNASSSTSRNMVVLAGDNHVFSHNICFGADGGGFVARDQAGDNIRVVKNEFYSAGIGGLDGCVVFETDSNGCLVSDNLFDGYRVSAGTTPVNSAVAFLGTGDNNETSDNKFRNCQVAALIEYSGGGTGHRVSDNKAPKGLNNNFLKCEPSMTSSDIQVIANTTDGYGTDNMGVIESGGEFSILAASGVNAGTDVLTTSTAHNYSDTDTVVFATTGTLPGNISAGVIYFVRDVSGSTFKIAATSGGVAIDITSTGSGTHRVYKVHDNINTDSLNKNWHD